jgi:predicted acetyltransferase
MAHLILPTTSVQGSYLQGETETAMEEGSPTSWLAEAAADFTGFVARRCGIRELWGVPVTELWFVDWPDYIGTVIIRHRLTPALAREGGHIGYHVVPRHRGRGHATQMLAQAKPACQALGLTELLITCGEDNIGSRRVIEAKRRCPRADRRWRSPLLATDITPRRLSRPSCRQWTELAAAKQHAIQAAPGRAHPPRRQAA